MPARKRCSKARSKRTGPKQLTIFDGRHGGPRENSGPKPEPGAGVPHDARERFRDRPVEITCKLQKGLPWLRRPRELETLKAALRESRERDGFRWCTPPCKATTCT